MYILITQMGLLGWPLIFLSVVGVALVLNRMFFFVMHRPQSHHVFEHFYACYSITDIQRTLHENNDNELTQIINTLNANRKESKLIRDELISHLLTEMKKYYYTGIRSLKLLALISPMLGLLGTVLGMIQAFHNIADSTSAVTPALIADGLWIAMLTTAYGLAIALPCLFASHLCLRAADKRIDSYEGLLNHLSLMMEGVEFPHKGPQA